MMREPVSGELNTRLMHMHYLEIYETLDLFVTIFNGTEEIQQVFKQDCEKGVDRLVKFFKSECIKIS